jgi:hypothetical protein
MDTRDGRFALIWLGMTIGIPFEGGIWSLEDSEQKAKAQDLFVVFSFSNQLEK